MNLAVLPQFALDSNRDRGSRWRAPDLERANEGNPAYKGGGGGGAFLLVYAYTQYTIE